MEMGILQCNIFLSAAYQRIFYKRIASIEDYNQLLPSALCQIRMSSSTVEKVSISINADYFIPIIFYSEPYNSIIEHGLL